MKLVTTILCPSRKVIEKKYGTCPKPVLFSDYSHDENTLQLLLNHIPEIYEINKNEVYLVILANIEGVMDIFNQGKRSNLKDWFQHNNIQQTYNLLRIGVNRNVTVSNDIFEADKINIISNNLYFISAKDLSFTDAIKSFLPNVLKKSNDITDIISYFYNNPEKHYSNNIEIARKELEKKCPSLDKNAIEEQTKYIRYALRRAIGVFLEAMHKYFKTNELIIESAFEPESLDVFHSTFNQELIKTTHSISKIKNRMKLSDNNVIIASQIALSFPIPNINSIRLFDTLKIHGKKIINTSKLQQSNKIKITQLILVNLFFGLGIKELMKVGNFITSLNTEKVVVIASQNGVYIASSFLIKKIETYKHDICYQSVFFNLLNNTFDKFNFYKLPDDLFFWNGIIKELSTSISVQTDEIKNSIELGFYITKLKLKILKQLFDYDEILEVNSEPIAFEMQTNNILLCSDTQTKLNVDFFEKIMKLPDKALFSIYDFNTNQYSMNNKLLCSVRFIETYFNKTIAKQLYNEFTEKIGYNETSGLLV